MKKATPAIIILGLLLQIGVVACRPTEGQSTADNKPAATPTMPVAIPSTPDESQRGGEVVMTYGVYHCTTA